MHVAKHYKGICSSMGELLSLLNNRDLGNRFYLLHTDYAGSCMEHVLQKGFH